MTAVAVGLANGSTRKSFFRAPVERVASGGVADRREVGRRGKMGKSGRGNGRE